jgi:putative membrane protein
MSDSEGEWDIGKPTRQSYLGVVVYMMRNFRALTTLLISLIAVAAAAPIFWTIVGIALIPLMILFSLFAYWQYRNFTFHVEGDELVIHKGVLVKERKTVPVERIQSIQVTKNVIQRILGLVALKVDTAGSRGNELEIPALERSRADALRDLLYDKKEALKAESATADQVRDETAIPGAEKERDAADERGHLLVHLGFFDLIKVGLTENHLKTGFIALAFVFGYASQYQEFLEEYLEGYVDTYASKVAEASLTLIIFGLVLYAVFSVLLSMIRTFLRFFDLRAELKSEAVEVTTGLLQRNEYRVPKRKIQYIEWETNPLRRLVGFESAKLKPSNAAGDVSGVQNIEIPALKMESSDRLGKGVFPGIHCPEPFIAADPFAFARFYAFLSVFLSAPLAFLLFSYFGLWGITSLGLLLLFAGLGYRYGKSVRVHFNEHFIFIKEGWLFPKRIVLPSYKLQSVELTQNFVLRRRKLCHMKFYTAAGSNTVRFLSERKAMDLYNFLIYTVERHEGSWM